MCDKQPTITPTTNISVLTRTLKCPQCNKTYVPTFDDPSIGTEMDKEQHLSGLCSDQCWDKFLGLY